LNAHKNGVEIALKAGARGNLEAEKESLREAKPPNKLEGESRRSEAPK